MKRLQQNTSIDFIRAILIILMILIHIVSFGDTYPRLKAGILSFMMPTFLIITGYLVNIGKGKRKMGKYFLCLALPYVIMVTGYSVLSYFMPVRDGIIELSLYQICEKIFVSSIGPYWFIQTMIICGILYYLSFKGTWGGQRICTESGLLTTDRLFLFAILLVLMAQTPALSLTAAVYYFAGVAIRQSETDFSKLFRPSFFAFPLWVLILMREDRYGWEFIAVTFSCWCCISSLMWLHKLIESLPQNGLSGKMYSIILYIGRNTLPVYLFHPIFTMAAKFYHPLFAWDKSEIAFAFTTVFLAIVGSIGIARLMELTKTSFVFGKGKILR